MSKIIWIFHNLFFIEVYQFRSTFFYWHFLVTSILKSLYFLKWCSIFDTSPLHQFSRFNNFLWVCWFFFAKIFPILYPPLENSTTRTTILDSNQVSQSMACLWWNWKSSTIRRHCKLTLVFDRCQQQKLYSN
jgi:hypothetical protein